MGNRFMRLAGGAVAVIAGLVSASLASASSVLDRLYPAFITGGRPFSDAPWVELGTAELPEPFRDDYTRSGYFVSAFRLVDANTILIFRVERPHFVARHSFCRSRVAIETLYNYDPGRPYFEQPRMNLEGAYEFVNFQSASNGHKCAARDLNDLSGYVLVHGRFDDLTVFQLWRSFASVRQGAAGSPCRFNGEATLTDVALGMDDDGDHYVLQGDLADKRVIITLERSEHGYQMLSCNAGKVTG
jgi:hypothetical protein